MLRVLIVEDEKMVAERIKKFLSAIADKVIIATTMHDAIREIGTTEQFDIITLDLNLPDSRMPHTLDKICDFKLMHPNALLIVLTGMLDRNDEWIAVEKGADGFMLKHEAARSESVFLATLSDIFRSLLRQPQRYTKSVKLLEIAVAGIAAHLEQSNQISETQETQTE